MIKTENGRVLKNIDTDICLQFKVSKDVDWSVLIEDRITGNYYVASNSTHSAVLNAMELPDTIMLVTYIERNEAFDLIDQQIPGIMIY